MQKAPRGKMEIALIFVLVVTIIISIYQYITNIGDEFDTASTSSLEEITSQQKYYLENDIDLKKHALKSMAISVENYTDNFDAMERFLSDMESYLSFNYIMLAGLDGKGFSSNGEFVDLSYLSFFPDLVAGREVVSNLVYSDVSKDHVVYLGVPIFDDDNTTVLGTVVACLSSEYFQSLLIPAFEDEGFVHLFDSNGTALAATKNNESVRTGDNLYEVVNKFEFYTDMNTQMIDNYLSSKEDGMINFLGTSGDSVLILKPIDGTEWMLTLTVPTQILRKNTSTVLYHTVLIFIEFLIIIAIIFHTFRMKEKKQLEKTRYIAYYDELTGLPNVKKLKEEMAIILDKNTDIDYVILKFDIVNFNVINKMFSFEIGDQILLKIAEFSTVAKDKGYVFARVGVDEFIAFGAFKTIDRLAEHTIEYEEAFNSSLKSIANHNIKFRYGRYDIPKGSKNINVILDNVTMAHHTAKSQPTASIVVYDDKLREQVLHNTYICSIMEEALANNEFLVYLQPKFSTKDSKIWGAEALVRWKRPDGKFIFPSDFIPIFEQDGFIRELDKYMLASTCKVIREIIDIAGKCVPVSINFSRLHMINEGFANEVTEIVDSYNIPRELIEIEITETAILEDETKFKELFKDLHLRGFSISMDDFGAGFSSFSLLQHLEFDVLKIDRSLLSDSRNAHRRNEILASIINMAKKLDIETVCEGVETIEQLELLKSINCNIAQGYYFAKPMHSEDFISTYYKEDV